MDMKKKKKDGHGMQNFTHTGYYWKLGSALTLLLNCSRLSICLCTVLRILLFLSWI